jgi:hypothetical protein
VTFTATQTGGATGFTAVGGGDITDCDNARQQQITYKATGTIGGSTGGTLPNTASITAPNGSTDPNLANNSATDNDTL